MNRKLLVAFITSGLQTVIFYGVFYLGWNVGRMIHEPKRMTVSELVAFGVLVKFSLIGFGVVILVVNLIDAFVNKKQLTWAILMVITSVYIIYWALQMDYIPLKAALFIVSGLIAVLAKFPIEKLLRKVD